MENFVYDIDSIRGLNLILKVPFPIFSYLCEEIFKFSLGHFNAFSVPQMLSIFKRESVDLSVQDQNFCINSLVYLVKYKMYIFRFIQKQGIVGDNLNRYLKDNTLIPEQHREYLIQLYSQYSQEQIKRILSLGKLKELKWTVNQYNGDSKYPNLKKLYILLEFNIQNEEGDLHKQLVNLTLQEFKVLQMEFKEIGDTLKSFQQEKS